MSSLLRTRLLAAALALSLFAAGTGTGVAVSRQRALARVAEFNEASSGDRRLAFVFLSIDFRLRLSEEQRQKFKQQLLERQPELNTTMASCEPGIAKVREKILGSLEQILDERQRSELHEILASPPVSR